MAYYLAPCLDVLRSEINQRWPRRDKASDGWIGDAAHQASRSDHNPNSRGSVNALDIDEDGIDVAEVIAAIEAHPSTHYWIYERQIADRDDGFRRRPYSGTNPHTKHLHVSIRQSRSAEQDRRPWGLLEDTMTKDQEAKLDRALRLLEKLEKVTWATTSRTDTMLSMEPASVFRVPGEDKDRSEPNQLAAALRQLTDRPAAEVDYDQLADAIVRRALTAGTSAQQAS